MYAYAGGATVRMSARPLTDVAAWPHLDDPSGAAPRAWLETAWSDPGFADAVEVASPALAAQVARLLAEPQPCPRAVRRAATSLLRYQLRATSRATPFGLFAGITTLDVGDSARVRVGTSHRAVARVDHSWITAVAGMLHVRGAAREMPVVVDGRVFVRDGRLVLPAPTADASGREVSARLTAPVAAAIQRAQEPVAYSALLDGVSADFPSANRSAVDGMLAALLSEGFLVSTLHPPMTTSDPLAHVVAASSGIVAGSDDGVVAGEVRTIHELIRRHDSAATAAARCDLRAAASARMRQLTGHAHPLGVDLVLDADITVPRSIPTEAAAAAAALVRLAPEPAGPPAWRAYHHRFLDQYGVGAVVPLPELLHAGTGLSLPAGYRGSHLPRVPPHRSTHNRRRAALLARLAHSAAWDRCVEVELTDADLDALTADVEIAPQPHTELRVEVHAPTRSALDEGGFELLVVGASRAAGTVTGRFLDLLDPNGTGPVTAALRGLPTATRAATRVQLSGPPAAPEAATIARSAAVLDRHVVVGGHPPAGSLRPADLAVSGDANGLYLTVAATGEIVEPTTFTALELVRCADPTLRFLAEIATAACTPCSPFVWDAALRELPFLPRLHYRRTVLSPARWTVRPIDLAPDATPHAWDAWRARWAVPDRVLLGQHDQRLGLDLTEPDHRHLLSDTLARTGPVTLLEAPAPRAFGWIDDHAHELVLPLATTVAARHPARPRPTSRTTPRPRHNPGASRWLSAHLDCRPDHQTVVLVEHLPRLLTDLNRIGAGVADSAWFLRLTEPDHHLRLRVQLPHPRHAGEAAAHIAAWADRLTDAGLAGELQFRTYGPETGRFGTGSALRAAETVFAADSAAVIAQLAVGGDDQALTAASMVDLVASFTASPAASWDWLVRHAPRRVASPPPREVRTRAIDLAHPDHAHLTGLPGGEPVVQAWVRRRAVLVEYRAALLADGIDPTTVLPDLLHLHHARTASPQLDREAVCLHLARAAALSHRTRAAQPRAAA